MADAGGRWTGAAARGGRRQRLVGPSRAPLAKAEVPPRLPRMRRGCGDRRPDPAGRLGDLVFARPAPAPRDPPRSNGPRLPAPAAPRVREIRAVPARARARAAAGPATGGGPLVPRGAQGGLGPLSGGIRSLREGAPHLADPLEPCPG